MLTITLPWPPRELSPNARHAHWSQLSRAKARYRAACALSAKRQGAARIDPGLMLVSLEFAPPDRRARDLDNLIASMKSGLDGLADVLEVDDRLWQLSARINRDSYGIGLVRVTVERFGADEPSARSC